jgi:hypothetical protein
MIGKSTQLTEEIAKIMEIADITGITVAIFGSKREETFPSP